MTSESAPPKFKRTQKLVDPRFQMGLACAVSMMMLGTVAVYMLGAKLLHSERVVNAMGAKVHGIVTMALEVGFFLGVVALIHTVVVRVTLGVVGPALVVERALKGMHEGRFDARLSLRDGDYLEPVATAASRLADSLKSDRAAIAAAVLILRSRGASEEAHDAALGRIESICRGGQSSAVSAEPHGEAVDAEPGTETPRAA